MYPRMVELVNDAFRRIGENVDALMDDLIRNSDIHEGSQEFQGEDEGEERRYKSLFDDARQSLYPSCPRELTKLLATVELYSLKVQKGWSDNSFNVLLQLVKKWLPVGNTLPESTYQGKKMTNSLGMTYESIHAQMIVFFIGKSTKMDKVVQYVIHPDGGQITWRKKKSFRVPLKVLRYFPLTPRLQRLYRLEFKVNDRFHRSFYLPFF
eukprot:TRINITY_DN2760_c0_g2_i2.p1 TRINITY_DN2760_c0_g2~~TRINITY_DN2760_c0_g2_i2.p1  ORF type:complete len:209 (+),score=17.92 TRINITY_DN2760_c0_g2_i2:1432-2058(+)